MFLRFRIKCTNEELILRPVKLGITLNLIRRIFLHKSWTVKCGVRCVVEKKKKEIKGKESRVDSIDFKWSEVKPD